MRRILAMLLFGAAVTLTACGEGESDANGREVILEHVKDELERSGASPAMTECVVGEFNRRLDLPKVRSAYEALPEDPSDTEVAQALEGISLDKDARAAVVACVRKLGLP